MFTLTVNDGHGGTSTGVVSLTINDVADVLTVGVDNVILSGATPQTVIGNQFTYNPGDSITGGTGSDTLSLGLTPSAPIVLGSATVTGIENFNVTVNPTVATDNVTLQMTLEVGPEHNFTEIGTVADSGVGGDAGALVDDRPAEGF